MTIFDLRCDRCGCALVGPASGPDTASARHGVRFSYHPGRADLGDNSSLVCTWCWATMTGWLGERPSDAICSVCSAPTTTGLFVQSGDLDGWRLCRDHAVEFLNTLRTVEPKLDPATFSFPC
jgi:hypothetical protein